MNDLSKAKAELIANEYTCVMCRGEDICVSVRRGVASLVFWIESKKPFNGFSAADKVVGKATAFLYVLLGVKAVYAQVISRAALQVLTEHGIASEYDKCVENIINRQGDGICPFEMAVLNITSPEVAYDAIREKMSEMNITP